MQITKADVAAATGLPADDGVPQSADKATEKDEKSDTEV